MLTIVGNWINPCTVLCIVHSHTPQTCMCNAWAHVKLHCIESIQWGTSAPYICMQLLCSNYTVEDNQMDSFVECPLHRAFIHPLNLFMASYWEGIHWLWRWWGLHAWVNNQAAGIMGACCSMGRDSLLHPQTCGKNRTDNCPGNSWSICFRGLHNLNFPDLHIIYGGSLLIPAHRRPLLCGFHVSFASVCGWYGGCWDGCCLDHSHPQPHHHCAVELPGSALVDHRDVVVFYSGWCAVQ